MEFSDFILQIQNHFQEMTKGAKVLFETDVDKEELWNLYLGSFPEETVCGCAHCRQFIQMMGNVVAIKNNVMTTIWEIDTGSAVFQPAADAMDQLVKSRPVRDVFVTKLQRAGAAGSLEIDKGETWKGTNAVEKYPHLYLEIPARLVAKGRRSEGDIRGEYRQIRQVFKRLLDKISQEAVQGALELIAQDSLYKGEGWKQVLTDFLRYKKEYDKLPQEQRECYGWEKSIEAGKHMEKLELLGSLGRRFAALEDITADNVLFYSRDAAERIGGGDKDRFSETEREIEVNSQRGDIVEQMEAERFFREVLPTARELEVFLQKGHVGNMVSLIAPVVPESEPVFKWNNNFSWAAYSGKTTGSPMRERVKEAGGNVDGALRFSIQWNESGRDESDLDAHCREPDGYEISFASAKRPRISSMGGQLDVDIMHPSGHTAVESITWADRSRMKTGQYFFFVHQFTNRGNRDGFRAEIEYEGTVYSFDCKNEMKTGERVGVAMGYYDPSSGFSVHSYLPYSESSIRVCGLEIHQYHPVSVVMLSPNCWDGQQGIGHRHYLFMIKGCVNDEMPDNISDEYLKDELMVHRPVFQALGSRCHVENSEDQLSGLVFSAGSGDWLDVKVKGETERTILVKF